MIYMRERFSRGLMGGVYIAVLAAIMIICLSSPSEGANSTAAGIVSGRSTDATSILVTMPYKGDDNTNNTYTIDYKTCAAGTWTNWVTNAPHSPSPYTTAITGLINNQCYSIRATYSDSDSISGSNPQTIQISAGWDNTLLHNSNRFPGTTKWSGDWGTPTGQYSRIICETCHTRTTDNIKRLKDSVITSPNSPAQRFPAETGGVAPVFLSVTAPNGFGDDTGGHSSSQKVCEVCHSQNIYHNFSTANNTGGLSHNNNTDCITCHSHKSGFSASCSTCHGNPPLDSATMVFSPGTTGSVTAGAHAVHSDTKQYPCSYCHYNSAGSGPLHNDGPPQIITMGFTLFGGEYTGGIYNGQTSAAYDSSQAGTTVSNNGAKNCVNIYCHGSTMVPNNGTNLTPVWDNAATAACGTCHGATAANPPLRGSHRTHVMNDTWTYDPGRFNPPNPFIYGRSLACTTCHNTNATAHVNGQADWSFNVPGDSRLEGATYKGSSGGASATASGAYGQCANLYCHSIAQTSTGGPLTGLPGEYQTPTWGALTEGTCGSCHYADQGHSWFAGRGTPGNYAPYIASGSHTKHLQSLAGSDPVSMDECAVCHNYNGSDALNGCASVCHSRNDLHVNHEIDVKFPATLYGTNAAYSGTPAPGDGYGACSNTYCHGNYPGSGKNATPTWGTSSTAACGTCHGSSNSPDGAPKSGSHEKHVDVDLTINGAPQGSFNRGYSCTLCHKGIVGGTGPASYTISDSSKHLNSKVDWSFDTADPRVSSDSAYSISSGTAVPSDGTTPRAYGSCSNVYCHSIVQTSTGGALTPNTTDYKPVTWGSSVNCGQCHKQDGSHYVGPTMDSGSHSKHLSYKLTAAYPYKKCELCHRYGTADITVDECSSCHVAGERTLHANGTVDISFYIPVVGSNGIYSGTQQPGDGFGTCSNTYCHGDGTSVSSGSVSANASPIWGTSSQSCDACHGYPPSYADGSPKANSHQGHDVFIMAPSFKTDYRCNFCHSQTTADGVTISNTANHVNNTYNVNPGSWASFSYSYSSTGSTCTNNYCHSNVQPNGGSGAPDSYATVAWGSPNGLCGSCHGKSADHNMWGFTTFLMDSGAHQAHRQKLYNYDCTLCHDLNPAEPYTCYKCHRVDGQRKHVNGEVDILFRSINSRAGNYSGTPQPGDGYGNCSNTYCHGDSTTPSWGLTTSLACNTCHSASSALAGAHSKHYEASIVAVDSSVTNNSTVAEYRFNCGICHAPSSAYHANGPWMGSGETADVFLEFTVMQGASPLATGGTYNKGVSAAAILNNPDRTFGWTDGTCSNIYCHSNGAYITNQAMFPLENTSPKWDGTSPDPQGDSRPCNNCHWWNIRHDAHQRHVFEVGRTCNECHAETVDQCNNGTLTCNIKDKSKHADGKFDLAGNFSYTFRPYNNGIGGQCSSNQCHVDMGVPTNWIDWTYNHFTSSISVTNQVPSGNACTVSLQVTNTSSYGDSSPYTFTFDWGDGAQTSFSGAAISTANHTYQARDNYTITWRVKDSRERRMASPNPGILVVRACNEPPEVDPNGTAPEATEFYLTPGPDTLIRDVVLHENAFDPDSNMGNHSGYGKIRISWYQIGSTPQEIEERCINLSNTPTERTYTHSYENLGAGASGPHYVTIAVQDNSGVWTCSQNKRFYDIRINAVLNPSNSSFSQCNDLTIRAPSITVPCPP